jgi:hypothetical protein
MHPLQERIKALLPLWGRGIYTLEQVMQCPRNELLHRAVHTSGSLL